MQSGWSMYLFLYKMHAFLCVPLAFEGFKFILSKIYTLNILALLGFVSFFRFFCWVCLARTFHTFFFQIFLVGCALVIVINAALLWNSARKDHSKRTSGSVSWTYMHMQTPLRFGEILGCKFYFYYKDCFLKLFNSHLTKQIYDFTVGIYRNIVPDVWYDIKMLSKKDQLNSANFLQ